MEKELSNTDWPYDRTVVEHLTHNSMIEGLNHVPNIASDDGGQVGQVVGGIALAVTCKN